MPSGLTGREGAPLKASWLRACSLPRPGPTGESRVGGAPCPWAPRPSLQLLEDAAIALHGLRRGQAWGLGRRSTGSVPGDTTRGPEAKFLLATLEKCW